MTFVFFALGLVLLVVGAELLVRGASRLAAVAGVSPLVIGLTVVAYGTSAPEMAVSVESALAGQPDIAVGNVVGSNIFNILFILGLCSLIVPMRVSSQLIRFDVPIMVAVSGLLYAFAYDLHLGFYECGSLLLLGIAYTVFVIRKSRQESREVQEEFAKEYGTAEKVSLRLFVENLVLVAIGIGLLVQGSGWLVDGAVEIARLFGVSELVISLTIVAAGTSLPEVAASVMAALRGERDIAIGNCVGSNIFNILSVLAVAGVASPAGIAVSAEALAFDIPIMLGIAVACLPVFYTRDEISRWEGGVFSAYYVLYTFLLVMHAKGDVLPAFFSSVVLFVILPGTAILFLANSAHHFLKRRHIESSV